MTGTIGRTRQQRQRCRTIPHDRHAVERGSILVMHEPQRLAVWCVFGGRRRSSQDPAVETSLTFAPASRSRQRSNIDRVSAEPARGQTRQHESRDTFG